MLKILIFGGSGLIGSRIRQILGTKYQIIAPAHQQVDVGNKEQIENVIRKSKPNYIIYSTALSSLDEAELHPEEAFLLNATAPEFIAKLAASFDIPVLYFSSDAVFDGLKSKTPYLEDDKTNPISQYGRSKLLGEKKVMNASDKNCVARVIMVYSPLPTKRKRFVQIVLQTLKKGGKFYGLIDQIVNPIYIDDIVSAVDLLIESRSNGIYHLGAEDYVSNYEFVKKLAHAFNLNENLVKAISLEEFSKQKIAPRNKFCWLDTSKFRIKFGPGILHSINESIYLFKNNLDLLEMPQTYQ